MKPQPGTQVTLVPLISPGAAADADSAQPGAVESIEGPTREKKMATFKPVPGVRSRITLPAGMASEGMRWRIGFAACLLAVVLLGAGCDGNTKKTMTPLTDPERAKLSDVARFNREDGRGGWRLNEREIDDLALHGIELTGAALENVVFDRTNMKGGRFIRCTFSDVEFLAAVVAGGTFEDCTFIKGRLTGVDASKATFRRCTFRETRLQGLEWPAAVLQDCRFESIHGENVRCKDAKISGCSFSGSMLKRWTSFGADLSNNLWSTSRVIEATFSGVSGSRLTFTDCQVEDSGFDGGGLAGLRFEKGSVSGTTFQAVQTGQILFTSCASVSRVGFLDSTLTDLAFQSCAAVEGLLILNTTVHGGTFADSAFEMFELTGATLDSGVVLRGSHVTSAMWTNSKISSLTLEKCTFAGPCSVEGTTFQGLKVVQLKTGSGYQLEGVTAATYVDSDRLLGS